MVLTVGVERAEIELHLGMVALERGGEIVAVEAYRAFGGPGASGVGGVAVGLVLIHNHVDGYALLLVGIDEAAEVVGVGAQVARILYHVVGRGELTRKHSVAGAGELHLVLVDFGRLGAEEQIVLLLREVVVLAAHHGVVAVDFHPARRTPRRYPAGDVGVILLCGAYEGYYRLLVAVDVEVVEVEVALDLVAAVP